MQLIILKAIALDIESKILKFSKQLIPLQQN